MAIAFLYIGAHDRTRCNSLCVLGLIGRARNSKLALTFYSIAGLLTTWRLMPNLSLTAAHRVGQISVQIPGQFYVQFNSVCAGRLLVVRHLLF